MVVVWAWMRRGATQPSSAVSELQRAREDVEKKKENLEKVRAFIADKERVANDDIEALLGVSDATATRYLDELEKEGRIRQVGRTGRHVYYEQV